jgi:hypothetical protein
MTPALIPSRFHRIARSIEYALAAAVLLGVIFWALMISLSSCNTIPKYRTDGNILEPYFPGYPRPQATTIKGSVTYPWALPPINEGAGLCHDPYFKLAETPPLHHTYTADETLTIAIEYKAKGCKNMVVTFGGRHHIGSPWYTHWCNDVIHVELNAPDYDCGNWIPSTIGRRATLASDEGTVVFQLGPGHNEGLLPGDPAVTTEGFQLCGLAILMNDGVPDGSRTSQGIELGCDSNSKADN